jgi:hypothetical protein
MTALEYCLMPLAVYGYARLLVWAVRGIKARLKRL